MLLLEISKLNTVEFKRVFKTLVETTLNIIANQIQEVSFLLVLKNYIPISNLELVFYNEFHIVRKLIFW